MYCGFSQDPSFGSFQMPHMPTRGSALGVLLCCCPVLSNPGIGAIPPIGIDNRYEGGSPAGGAAT